ncbi:MAG: hypothetical protein GEV07_12105 [Streptosporangiales bacterium]|nr:hypothetical protein [Streptosporangiales bacterium]
MSYRNGVTRLGHALGVGLALSALVLTTAGCGGGGGASSEMSKEECEKYPEKEVELVIGRSPGGGYDEYGRFLAPLLKKRLGTNIVVKNEDGAGGRVAASQVYGADPDGYTIHITEPNGLAALQVVQEVDYDLPKYTHLGLVNNRPSTFAVSTKSDIKTFDDLVEAGKKKKKLKFANAGLTSPNFINGLIASEQAGIKLTSVPHEGSSEAITSLVRGDTDFTVFSGDSIAEAVDAGEVRALAQFGSEPLDMLGDTPMAEDVGLGDLAGKLTTDLIFVAPPDLPSCVQKKLTKAVQGALNSDEFAAFGEKGRIVQPGTPAQQRKLIKQSVSFYKQHADTYRKYLTR